MKTTILFSLAAAIVAVTLAAPAAERMTDGQKMRTSGMTQVVNEPVPVERKRHHRSIDRVTRVERDFPGMYPKSLDQS